jgi:hypothetical protein
VCSPGDEQSTLDMAVGQPNVVVTDAIDAEAREAISGGLHRFNIDQTGIDDWRPWPSWRGIQVPNRCYAV